MKYNQNGQTLIEALVALGIIVIVMTSLASIITNSLYNSGFIKDQNLANKYSEQGMELVRNIRGTDLNTFNTFNNSPAVYCVDGVGTGLTQAGCNTTSPNTGALYNRTIQFERDTAPCDLPTNDETKVTVTTRWTSSKCGTSKFCHKSIVSSCLSNSGTTP